MRSRYSSPYVVYNGKIAIIENALHFLKNSYKTKYLFPKEVIKDKIKKGEMIVVKDSERYGKSSLLDYESLRPTVKMTLKINYGLPPKIINEYN